MRRKIRNPGPTTKRRPSLKRFVYTASSPFLVSREGALTARRDWNEEKKTRRDWEEAPPLVRSCFRLFSSAISHTLSTIQKGTASSLRFVIRRTVRN